MRGAHTQHGAQKESGKTPQKATSYNLENAKDTYNKFQVLKCSECGTRMTRKGTGIKKSAALSATRCTETCLLHKAGMPFGKPASSSGGGRGTVQRTAPTLLFGTVDKFAMLSWENQWENSFG